MKKYDISYFLGANSPYGFISFFDELYSPSDGWRCFIIKGGPGTGKSTLMKGIAEKIEKSGYEVERIFCSSDPDSLDAIKCSEMKIAVADGTAPHILEPKFPGAVECIVDMGDGRNDGLLFSQRDKIIDLTKKNSACHARCVRFLKTAGILISDSRKLSENFVLDEKISLYAKRFVKRNIKSNGTHGQENRIFLSALTPKGSVFLSGTVKHFADRIIEIDDSVGTVCALLVDRLRNEAMKNGADVICGYCPLDPNGKPEHIILPCCRTAFVRKHNFYGDIGATRTIHAQRFYSEDFSARHKQKISFAKKISDEMIHEAVKSLKQAKKIHDELEKIYISAMDFEKTDMIKKRTIEKIFDVK